jgi:ketosteroid isomerase-like protein
MNRTNYRAAILRKQPDGNWRIAADNPFGPEPPPVLEPVTVL